MGVGKTLDIKYSPPPLIIQAAHGGVHYDLCFLPTRFRAGDPDKDLYFSCVWGGLNHGLDLS